MGSERLPGSSDVRGPHDSGGYSDFRRSLAFCHVAGVLPTSMFKMLPSRLRFLVRDCASGARSATAKSGIIDLRL